MVDKEVLGGQQVLKYRLVALQVPIDYAVGFLDEKTGRAQSVAAGVLIEAITAFDVLENLRCVRISKELAKEADEFRV